MTEEVKQVTLQPVTPQQNDVLRSGSKSSNADKSAGVSEVKQVTEKIVGKEYTDSNGRKYTYRISQGKRKLKDGRVVTFEYKKIYYSQDHNLRRGPKVKDNKKSLRKIAAKLTDAQCAEMLKYINDRYFNT